VKVNLASESALCEHANITDRSVKLSIGILFQMAS
jgi:hypothetical protein